MEDIEEVSNSIPKKQYRKPTSVANAQKAREGRARARAEQKARPPSEDEYSEDEIIYVPTRRKTKKEAPSQAPPQGSVASQLNMHTESTGSVTSQLNMTKELEELKKQLEQLRSLKSEPVPIQQPKTNPHSDMINMAKSRILNF